MNNNKLKSELYGIRGEVVVEIGSQVYEIKDICWTGLDNGGKYIIHLKEEEYKARNTNDKDTEWQMRFIKTRL